MKNVFTLFLCMLVWSSCQFESADDLPVIDCKNGEQQSLIIHDYFAEVTYIPLESTKECMLSDMARFYLSDKAIIVIDKEILLFDRANGKFLGKVGKKGQGPDEYVSLMGAAYYSRSNSVLADKGKQWVEINVPTQAATPVHKPDVSAFMRFSSNDEVNAELAMFMPPILYTEQLKDDLYAGYVHNIDGKNPVKLITYNRAGEIKSKIPNYLTFEDNTDMMMQYRPVFYTVQEETYFKEMFNDTIFRINATDASPVYVFDMGERGLPYSGQDKEFDWSLFKVVTGIGDTGDDLFFTYDFDSHSYIGVMNKKDGKVCFSKDGWIDTKNPFIPLFPNYQTPQGDVLCVLPAEKVASRFSTYKDTNVALEQLKTVREDDNPVVVILVISE